MINSIEIGNFKGIKSCKIECKNLTLLSGANASGKSTVLHTLLLLIQSTIGRKKAKLILNGEFVKLGTAGEIEYNWSDKPTILLKFETNSGVLKAEFDVALSDSRDVVTITLDQKESSSKFIKKLKYLSASRIVPSHIFPNSTDEISTYKNLGISGQYTFAYLATFGANKLAIQKLTHPDAAKFGVKGSLLANVTAWIQQISPGLELRPEIVQEIGASRISYGYSNSTTPPSISPHNVGFGITYVLPVITRILMSEPGEIVILENPEAHIHPRGQVELGKLLALAANNGVQIFLETHSDHIFNGVRLQLKDSTEGFKNCVMYYAKRTASSDKYETQFKEIILNERGGIRSAPKGFFDEWENSIMSLI